LPGSRRSLEADEAASGAAAAAAASAAAAVPAAAAAAAAAAAVVVDDESAAEPAAQATGEGLKDYEPVDVGAQVEPSPSARGRYLRYTPLTKLVVRVWGVRAGRPSRATWSISA